MGKEWLQRPLLQFSVAKLLNVLPKVNKQPARLVISTGILQKGSHRVVQCLQFRAAKLPSVSSKAN